MTSGTFNGFVMTLDRLDGFYNQTDLENIWDDNLHIEPIHSKKTKGPTWPVDSRIIDMSITELFNDDIMEKPPTCWMICKDEFPMYKHIDQTILMLIPLSPHNYELDWVDDNDNVIYKHAYGTSHNPVIVNSLVDHIPTDTLEPRKHFAISLHLKDQSWESLIEHYNHDRILK